MYTDSLKPDIFDLASRESAKINKGDIQARRRAFTTLSSLILEVKFENIDINQPLIDLVSDHNYPVPGLNWNNIFEQLIDLQRDKKPRFKRIFRKEAHRIGGSIVLPSLDPTSYYELEIYYRKRPTIKYKKGPLEIVYEGDYPYYILGLTSHEILLTEVDKLVGSRLFFSKKMYEEEIQSERWLHRRKLIEMLHLVSSEVIKRIE